MAGKKYLWLVYICIYHRPLAGVAKSLFQALLFNLKHLSNTIKSFLIQMWMGVVINIYENFTSHNEMQKCVDVLLNYYCHYCHYFGDVVVMSEVTAVWYDLICPGWFPSVNTLLVNRTCQGSKSDPWARCHHTCNACQLKQQNKNKKHYYQSVQSCLNGLILWNGAIFVPCVPFADISNRILNLITLLSKSYLFVFHHPICMPPFITLYFNGLNRIKK